MARKEQRSGRHGKTHEAKPAASGGKAAPFCTACGVRVQADAKFCQQCGARLGTGSRFGLADVLPIAFLAALVALVFAAVVGLAYLLHPDLFHGPRSVSDAPAATAEPSVDLSRMSPRQAADRLFNRVMAAQEKDNLEEARRFAPMALEAYGDVAVLDADAQYHLGLLYGVVDDEENMRRQIETLKDIAPNHLLAFALEHELAQKLGDAEAAARAVAALRAAYESEMATGRPEYGAHSFTIERLRQVGSQ